MPRQVCRHREPDALEQLGAVPCAESGRCKKTGQKGPASLDDLARTALKAFLIARDAAFNVRDLLTHSSRMAFLAIKECEQELDVIERYIDERTAGGHHAGE